LVQNTTAVRASSKRLQHQQVVRQRKMFAAHAASLAARIVSPLVSLETETRTSDVVPSEPSAARSMPPVAVAGGCSGQTSQQQQHLLPTQAKRRRTSTHEAEGHCIVDSMQLLSSTDPMRPAQKKQVQQVPGSRSGAEESGCLWLPFMSWMSPDDAISVSLDGTELRIDSPSHSPSPGRGQRWGDADISMSAGRLNPTSVQTAVTVTVVAPGGGTRANAAAYAELARTASFRVEIAGQSGALYDRYPTSWPQGSAGPNLETFAHELLNQRVAEKSDCLVIGSRGGQVVLPTLWQALGNKAPPTVVINGGCAMKLPKAVHWPTQAISFLLMGGQDYFRGAMSLEEYVADAKSRVPAGNATTAILFVNEMPHMPQSTMLAAALPQMLETLLSWQKVGSGNPPEAELHAVLSILERTGQWSGRLLYTESAGVWRELPFGPRPSMRMQHSAAVGGA